MSEIQRQRLRASGRGSCVLLLSCVLAVAGAQGFGQAGKASGSGLSPASAGSAPPSNAQLASPSLNERVEKLLRRMTLEEKVGQLTQYAVGQATGPGAVNQDYKADIAKGEVGSLLNVVGADQTNVYQHIAVDQTRLHIPLLFGYDVIHGERTIFPVPLALASSFDPALVTATARIAAEEARADGIRWVFSPMVDIARDARWGRIVEGAGEDLYLGNVLARAYVEGYQQGNLGSKTAVAACVKHFAAYGAVIAGRDYNAVDMSELMLRQVYLPPYEAAVRAGAATVMSAFTSLNGVPETANPFTLTQVLRREWGFDGFVVSDWNAVRELLAHGVAADPAAAARLAIMAGTDMDMEGHIYQTQLAALVDSGKVPDSVLDAAVRRVLRVKFALGLFDDPYTEIRANYRPSQQNRETARRAAEESFVLLKNDPQEGRAVLPLRGSSTIALIGPLADSPGDMMGSWQAKGNQEDVITLRAALARQVGEQRLLYAKGTEITGTSESGFAAALHAAQQADIVVMALGEDALQMTGEASSRAKLNLPGNQEQLLESIAATGKPVVLVLFNGHPLAIPWAAEHIPAILEAWYPGIEAGPALVNVLFGEVSPAGKLPVSFPRSVGQEPLYYAQTPTGRPAGNADLSHPPTGGDRAYSRYIDEQNSAQFPFGWGLSYTTFSYSHPVVDKSNVPMSAVRASREGGTPLVTVGVDVKNTGPVTGTEVVQLYLRNTVARVEQPLRELKGFVRVTLQPGEEKHVEFPLNFDALSYYDSTLQQIVEPTHYKLWVGGNSQALLQTEFAVTE